MSTTFWNSILFDSDGVFIFVTCILSYVNVLHFEFMFVFFIVFKKHFCDDRGDFDWYKDVIVYKAVVVCDITFMFV